MLLISSMRRPAIRRLSNTFLDNNLFFAAVSFLRRFRTPLFCWGEILGIAGRRCQQI